MTCTDKIGFPEYSEKHRPFYRDKQGHRKGLIAAGFMLGLIILACDNSGGVNEPPQLSLSHLSLFPDRLVAVAGETIVLQVIARDQAGTSIADLSPRYTSSNPAVVRIESDGRIVAENIGTAIVKATAGNRTAEAVVQVSPASYDLGSLGPPRILDANYIDLSKIERISRFRSTVGHSFTDGSETCRSMKHYFQPKLSVDWTSVDIYAPVSGTIWLISSDGAYGKRIVLRPREMALLYVTIFHVNIDSGIVAGTWVESGDHIGRHASSSTMSDIAISIGPNRGDTLISYFEAMTDEVFSPYYERGISSRDAAIITQAERDADPVPCVGESGFTVHGTLPDWLILN